MEKQIDVIIVGTGAAGLFSALSLPKDCNILMITKDKVENSDSYLAQGGISMLKDQEDYDSYFEDTMKAGQYKNNKESVRIMIESSQEIIGDLIEYGVDFQKNPDGSFAYTREGAHSTFRILYHQDITGKEITTKLIEQVKKRKNVRIQTYTTMIDLIIDEDCCKGIVVERKDGKREIIRSKTVILATGGIGGLFQNSTNFPHITGDSFAIAIKHGIVIEHMDYIQIHPTTLYSRKGGRRFLISESVRGEGAVLLNEKHQRFVNELLPRDVVTQAIRKEMERTKMDHVYLSLTHMGKEEIMNRFPNIYGRCLEEGYDLSKEPVPVVPAQHYIMGGIKVGVNGETSMCHLYAVGETACNGVHGANRLASNSLLESLVFAKRAARLIGETIDGITITELKESLQLNETDEEMKEDYRNTVLDEIKREDEDFYVKWCDHEN